MSEEKRAETARGYSRMIVLVTLAFAAATVKWLSLRDGWDQPFAVVASGEPRNPVVAEQSVGDPERANGVGPRVLVDPAKPALVPARPDAKAASIVLAEEDRSPLADELHAPEATGMQDLGVVMNLFTEYRVRFRSYPVGEDNATFVNALTGQNPQRLALLPKNHPAIDARGQLLDRWGKPFFFHLLSRDALEIRSGGADGELYSGDDLIMASPRVKEAALALKGE